MEQFLSFANSCRRVEKFNLSNKPLGMQEPNFLVDTNLLAGMKDLHIFGDGIICSSPASHNPADAPANNFKVHINGQAIIRLGKKGDDVVCKRLHRPKKAEIVMCQRRRLVNHYAGGEVIRRSSSLLNSEDISTNFRLPKTEVARQMKVKLAIMKKFSKTQSISCRLQNK